MLKNCYARKEEKNPQKKIPDHPSPLEYQMVRPLYATFIYLNNSFYQASKIKKILFNVSYQY